MRRTTQNTTVVDLKHAVERQEEQLNKQDTDIKALTSKVDKDIEKSEHWIKAWIDKIDKDRAESEARQVALEARQEARQVALENRVVALLNSHKQSVQWTLAIMTAVALGAATIIVTILR